MPIMLTYTTPAHASHTLNLLIQLTVYYNSLCIYKVLCTNNMQAHITIMNCLAVCNRPIQQLSFVVQLQAFGFCNNTVNIVSLTNKNK